MAASSRSLADVLMPQTERNLLEEEEHSDDEQAEDEDVDEYSRGAPRLPWGVTKKVVREAPVGVWDEGRPKSGDKVTVHFVAKLQDGTQVGSSRDTDTPFEFVLDQRPREVVLGMELAVITMRRTEVAEFKLAPRFAYDELGSPPLIPPGATMLFEVEVLSWVTQEDLFGDGCAVKTVLHAGSGEAKPERGQEVVISMKCMDRKGKVIQEHEHLEHTVGDPIFGPLSRIVVTSLMHMLEGEKATVALTRDAVPSDRQFAKATVDLELERVFESKDISLAKDKSLIKKVLHRGEGSAAVLETNKVRLRVEAATDGSGEAVYGFSGPKTLQFAAGDGDMCDALEFAVLEMKVGERAALTCSPPAPQCMELELGLVRFETQRVVLTVELLAAEGSKVVPVAEHLAWARARKDAAAGLYRRQRYALALHAYTRIVQLLEDADSDASSRRAGGAEEAAELRRLCELNRAACMLKLCDFAGARASCDEVLRASPDHVKALFRRASAHFGLSDYAAALRDLGRVLSLDAGNSEARALVGQVKEAQKSYAKAAKQTAARMISCQEGAADASSEPLIKEEQPTGAQALSRLTAASACLPLRACLRLLGGGGARKG